MNALAIRVDYAKAELSIMAGQDSGFDHHQCTLDAAFSLGIRHFETGRTEMPLLFSGMPDLEENWHSGQDFAYLYAVIRHCQSCKDANGNPCMLHG